MFIAMISEPASPNPSTNNYPIFTIEFWIKIVSFSYSFSFLVLISFISLVAAIGLVAIRFTFSIIFSRGYRAISFTSAENQSAPIVRTMQTNSVLTTLIQACFFATIRPSSTSFTYWFRFSLTVLWTLISSLILYFSYSFVNVSLVKE